MAPSSKTKKFFSKFYDQHVKKVYRFIFLKVDSKETSQDLTSEVFLRFWKQLNSATRIENPRAFVYQVARNLIIDHYRRNEPIKLQIEEFQIKDPNPNPETQFLADSEFASLKKVLAKIPEDYQNMIIWYYLDEFSVAEIAGFTGKTENNVRVTIHRALKTLREKVEGSQKRLFNNEEPKPAESL